jgi:putative endonuclease
MPFVYILRCGDGSLYTGIAKDLDRRLEQHRCGQASRYTRSHLPVTLVWTRKVRSWSLALREELRIKAMRKAEKEAMVSSVSPNVETPRGASLERRKPFLDR